MTRISMYKASMRIKAKFGFTYYLIQLDLCVIGLVVLKYVKLMQITMIRSERKYLKITKG